MIYNMHVIRIVARDSWTFKEPLLNCDSFMNSRTGVPVFEPHENTTDKLPSLTSQG